MSDKSEATAIEVTLKDAVLKYVADGKKINIEKAKEAIAALNAVLAKVKGAAKKQIDAQKAALDAAAKEFE